MKSPATKKQEDIGFQGKSNSFHHKPKPFKGIDPDVTLKIGKKGGASIHLNTEIDFRLQQITDQDDQDDSSYDSSLCDQDKPKP